ncbi:MAG TPA: hypothetical protein ENH24_00140 [Nitrospirae bacterium]|nr:hypothetical protein [Nitrospirota bacterium]
MKRTGAITVDTDTLTILANAYNLRTEKDNNTTYSKIIPRFLDRFKEYDIRATFFIIGKYAKMRRNHAIIRRIITEGHEIANHTMNHPPNFSGLPDEQKEKEITDMQKIIKEISGYDVRGFRAPEWDIDRKAMDMLEQSGYLYDSSVFPTWFRYAMKIAVIVMSRGRRMEFSAGEARFIFSPAGPYYPAPHNIASDDKKAVRNIIELPVTVSPWLRLPFFGTSIMAFGSGYFRMIYPFVRASKNPLIYELHTVELFDEKHDPAEQAVFKTGHPVLKAPFAERLRIFRKSMESFLDDYNLVTMRELALKYNKAGSGF